MRKNESEIEGIKLKELEYKILDELLYIFTNIVMDNNGKISDKEISYIAARVRKMTIKYGGYSPARGKEILELMEWLKDDIYTKVYGKSYDGF